MNRPLLACLSSLAVCSYGSIALGWDAASDERRRQMTINDMNRNTERAAQRANQSSFGGGRYSPSSPASSGSSSGSSSSSSSSYNSLDAIGESLDQYQKRQPTHVTTYTITRKESSQELAARIRAGAERGDAFMQWTLGRMYHSGVGVSANPAEAVKWFRAAADQGHDDGQASLGDMYSAGTGVPKDDATAVSWWVKAARQGQGVAAKNAGVSYQNGWGVPRSAEKAREFYKISADTREPEAALWLGEMYRDGAFGSPDMTSARPLFKIAAEQGHLIAMDAYAFSLFSVDQATGLIWLRKAASGGLPHARFSLGMAMLNGLGMPKDEAGGAKMIIDSAPGVEGETKPLIIAATIYFHGVGVKKNVVEAVRYYRMAAERKDPVGEQAIGEVRQKSLAGKFGEAEKTKGFNYLEGTGVPKDADKAFQFLLEAAEAGNIHAMGGVGSLYQEGVGTKVDRARGAFYLHTSALLGLTAGKREYGDARCMGDGVAKDEAEGFKWATEAAAEGDADAHALLGRLYEKGECRQAKDLVKARAEYKIAADGGADLGKKGLERLGK